MNNDKVLTVGGARPRRFFEILKAVKHSDMSETRKVEDIRMNIDWKTPELETQYTFYQRSVEKYVIKTDYIKSQQIDLTNTNNMEIINIKRDLSNWISTLFNIKLQTQDMINQIYGQPSYYYLNIYKATYNYMHDITN